VLSGGPSETGAARLAAEGALRAGAGLVTLAGPTAALPVMAAQVTEILLAPANNGGEVARLLAERKRNVALVGPGNGVGSATAENVLTALRSGAKCVLDADALTSFADRRDELLAALRPGTVLTPHDGEFARLFPVAAKLNMRLERARAAAAESGAIVLLKGPDTVVAHPSGRAVINSNAPATLATAGSGDVLGGFVAGLRAQGMDAFEAAAASVWLHGEAAQRVGQGLIASDLHRVLPEVLAKLRGLSSR
jgi:NAD(P)H-hydrate epimerase